MTARFLQSLTWHPLRRTHRPKRLLVAALATAAAAGATWLMRRRFRARLAVASHEDDPLSNDSPSLDPGHAEQHAVRVHAPASAFPPLARVRVQASGYGLRPHKGYGGPPAGYFHRGSR